AADLENRIHAATTSGDPDQVIRAFERLFREYKRDVALPFEFGLYLLSIGREKDAERQLAAAWSMIDRAGQPSPYEQETAFHYCRAKVANPRRFVEHGRRGVKSNEITANGETLDAALKRIEDAIQGASKETPVGHAPLYAMKGEILFLSEACLAL